MEKSASSIVNIRQSRTYKRQCSSFLTLLVFQRKKAVAKKLCDLYGDKALKKETTKIRLSNFILNIFHTRCVHVDQVKLKITISRLRIELDRHVAARQI